MGAFQTKVDSKLMREFNVESVLGSGAFGTVLKAKNKFDTSSYAIKLIEQSNPQDQEKSIKEVQVFSKLSSHENVVAYKAAWIDRLERSALQEIIIDLSIDLDMLKRLRFNVPLTSINIMCIQMELCGQDLRSWMKKRAEVKKKVNERKYWRIFGQLLKGLRHIHNHKILHRDLKPDNIFLIGNGEVVKIGDLGLGKSVPDNIYVDGEHTVAGTICYMPPEQFTGLYSKAVDIYPLGIILTELFAMDKQPELMLLIMSLRHGQIPKNIIKRWPEVAVLISRMLQNEPGERITLNEILKVHKEIKKEFARDTHQGIFCNGCGKFPIRGIRFDCMNCESFDLCEDCNETVPHDPTHLFEALSEVETKKRQQYGFPGIPSSKSESAAGAANVDSNSNTISSTTTTAITQGVNCWKCKKTGLNGVVHKCTECTLAYYCLDCFGSSAEHVIIHKFESINLDEVQVEPADLTDKAEENLIHLDIMRRLIELRERERGSEQCSEVLEEGIHKKLHRT